MTTERIRTSKAATRRKFLAGAAVTGAAAVAMPQVSRAQTATLKMQGSWGAKDVFNEMAQDYVARVNEMAGGRLKIDFLVGGSVVHPFQVLDGVHGGQIDGAHTVTVYWYGKHKAASLFGTGPVFGFNANEGLGWIHNGGGKRALRGAADPDHEGQCHKLLRHADADPAARLVQEAGEERGRPEGSQVSYRRPGRRPVPGDGSSRSRSCRAARSCRPWSVA